MQRDRSNYRKRQDHGGMPRWFRRAVDAMGGSRPREAKDCFYSIMAAGIEPFPLTDEKLSQAERFLNERGLKQSHVRGLGWRRALDALEARARERAGLAAKLRKPAGRRTLNAPRGTFPALEAEIEAVAINASRPRATICDPHNPVKADYVRAQGRRVLVVATRLAKAGKIGTDVTLSVLLGSDLQQAHLELIDKQDEEGRKVTWVSDYLAAIRFFAARVHGHGSDQAAFALAQQQQRGGCSEMTEVRLRKLLNLLSAEKLVSIRRVPDALMAEAEHKMVLKEPRYRLSAARRINVAAAIALQTELLMKSHQLTTLEFDSDGLPIRTSHDRRRIEALPLSMRTLEILARRRQVLEQMGLPTTPLFPGKTGRPAMERSVIRSVQRAMDASGLSGVTLECLRDLGAVLLIREGPRQIRRVAVLLGMCSTAAVRRRYHPFLRAPKP